MNQKRLDRVVANMAAQGLGQIVVSAPTSVYYLTGLYVEPMERMLALLIRDDGSCTLYANELFALPPQPDLPIKLHTDSDDPAAILAADLRPGKLGVDKWWPSKFLIGILSRRSDVVPVLGSAPVDEARMCKDAEEIAAMRHASRINDGVMAAAIGAIHAGATEAELADLVERTFRAQGADRSSEGQLVCFGPNGADPHHSPNDTVLRRGDSVVLDIFIPIRRYWCDMTRTVFFGAVSDEGRRVYDTVRAANEAAEAMIRPGIPMTTPPPARSLPDRGWSSRWSRESTCRGSWGSGWRTWCWLPREAARSSTTIPKEYKLLNKLKIIRNVLGILAPRTFFQCLWNFTLACPPKSPGSPCSSPPGAWGYPGHRDTWRRTGRSGGSRRFWPFWPAWPR